MLLRFKDEDGVWNIVADGYIGNYKTTVRPNKKVMTVFTLLYNYNAKTKEYRSAKATAWGDETAVFISNARRHGTRIVVFGNSTTDKSESSAQGRFVFQLYATAILPVAEIIEMYNWHKGTMRYDKSIEKTASQGVSASGQVRYDYNEETKAEDHMI